MDDGSFLMARDYKYFEAARNAACESDFKIHVGAVAVYKGKIIASAASSEKTHPMQKVYNTKYRHFNQIGLSLPKVHAEIRLLSKIKKWNVPMKDISIYVYRTCKSRKSGLARPCPACMNAIVATGVRVVYYTTDYGYAKEWLVNKGA